MNNCFSIYTSWITSGPKSNFICDDMPTKAILLFFGCSEVNSTWLITSELANQRARKVLFTCVVCCILIQRGAGVPGYGVPGCGKHGVWWKTRGLSAKHSGTIMKSKFCYFKLQWKSIGVKRVFCHKSELNISWERKSFKCQLDMQWSLHGASVLYFAVTCVDLLFILKNCEMLTIVLLSIFNREKRQ